MVPATSIGPRVDLICVRNVIMWKMMINQPAISNEDRMCFRTLGMTIWNNRDHRYSMIVDVVEDTSNEDVICNAQGLMVVHNPNELGNPYSPAWFTIDNLRNLCGECSYAR